eukprot:scaffold132201_cov29-Tisochrysis_lutea.AAC.2
MSPYKLAANERPGHAARGQDYTGCTRVVQRPKRSDERPDTCAFIRRHVGERLTSQQRDFQNGRPPATPMLDAKRSSENKQRVSREPRE